MEAASEVKDTQIDKQIDLKNHYYSIYSFMVFMDQLTADKSVLKLSRQLPTFLEHWEHTGLEKKEINW